MEIYGGHFTNIHWLTEWMNEWADELYGARIITVNRSHGRNMNFSQTIWLTLRKDVDFILFTPHFIYFITIYFLKRRSGQYQNKAEDSVFNYLFQGRTSHANAAWARSSKQKHFFFFVCFPWKCWTECMKLILIRVGFKVLSFNGGDKILIPQPSLLSGSGWWEPSPAWSTGGSGGLG